VTLERVTDVARAGAAGLAAVGLFASADVADTVRHVRDAWRHPVP